VVRDGIEGLLIPPSDPPALAEALARILEDVPLARRLGEAGRRRAREYAWSTVGRRIEMAYEEAI
jgi:glycosyltransferase involved in cell wall biosynthesis